MKRLLLPLLAGLAIISTGCSSDETVEAPKGQAIEFTRGFVNKTGRAAETERGNINTCLLWGSSSEANGYIFDAQALQIVADYTTEYDPKRYWSKNTDYHFLALGSSIEKSLCYGPGKIWQYDPPTAIPADNGLFGTLTYNNDTRENGGAYGEEDLIYAGADHTTDGDISNEPIIDLTFNHALSRIRFLFTNNMTGYYLEVKNVTVSGLPTKGTLDFATKTWTVTSGYTLSKGFTVTPPTTNGTLATVTEPVLITYEGSAPAQTETMYTIPFDTQFTVSFDLFLWLRNEDGTYTCQNESSPYHHDVPIATTETITGADGSSQTINGLRMGRGYAYRAIIGPNNVSPDGLYPIEFNAQIEKMGGSVSTILDTPTGIADETL